MESGKGFTCHQLPYYSYILNYNGLFCSMSWLKRKFRKLGLKRRESDPPEESIKALIQVPAIPMMTTQSLIFIIIGNVELARLSPGISFYLANSSN